MTDRFRATLAQLGPAPGDLAGNAAQAMTAWTAARAAGSDLLALPQLFLTGPDLGDRPPSLTVLDAVQGAITDLAQRTSLGPALLIGAPCRTRDGLHDAYWVCQGGQVTARVLKHTVATDGPFDHDRLFDPAPIPGPISVGAVRIGVLIGEDAQAPDVAEAQAESGAEILLAPTAAPFSRGGHDRRLSFAVARVVETGLPLIQLNGLCGDGEITCDGTSFVLNRGGVLAHQLEFCAPGLRHVDFTRTEDGWTAATGDRTSLPAELEQEYRILVEATAHRLRLTEAGTAILDLSGGIDSALAAVIAADASGANDLRCVIMRAGATSHPSVEIAEGVTRHLGCRMEEVRIDRPAQDLAELLDPLLPRHADFSDLPGRLRSLCLATLAETTGALPLTAANKTRVALGTTQHGAVVGGYNPVRDVFGTRVMQLLRWRAATHRTWMRGPAHIPIPPDSPVPADDRTIAGVSPEMMDDILQFLLDPAADPGKAEAAGHDAATVSQVAGLVRRAQFTRAAIASGPRLSSGTARDRRDPPGHAWSEWA